MVGTSPEPSRGGKGILLYEAEKRSSLLGMFDRKSEGDRLLIVYEAETAATYLTRHVRKKVWIAGSASYRTMSPWSRKNCSRGTSIRPLWGLSGFVATTLWKSLLSGVKTRGTRSPEWPSEQRRPSVDTCTGGLMATSKP